MTQFDLFLVLNVCIFLGTHLEILVSLFKFAQLVEDLISPPPPTSMAVCHDPRSWACRETWAVALVEATTKIGTAY